MRDNNQFTILFPLTFTPLPDNTSQLQSWCKISVKGKKELESRFWSKLEVFTKDPFDPSLRTHKLSGKLKDLWSFSVEYDERLLFYFTDDGNAVFVDIGNHDEVY